MEMIFMNKEKNKMNEPQKIVLNSQRLDLRTSNKHVPLQNLSTYYMWKNVTEKYRNNELKITAPTRNGKFELPDLSYFVSGIQDYIECITKSTKH